MFKYLFLGVISAVATTLQVYSLTFPAKVIAHSYFVRLAPNVSLLVIFEARHLGLGLWTVIQYALMEGMWAPQGVLCFVAFLRDLLQYFMAESSALELVNSLLSAQEAEARARELLVMMIDAVVGLDQNLAFLYDSQKLGALFMRSTVRAGTCLQQRRGENPAVCHQCVRECAPAPHRFPGLQRAGGPCENAPCPFQ